MIESKHESIAVKHDVRTIEEDLKELNKKLCAWTGPDFGDLSVVFERDHPYLEGWAFYRIHVRTDLSTVKLTVVRLDRSGYVSKRICVEDLKSSFENFWRITSEEAELFRLEHGIDYPKEFVNHL